MSENNLKGRQIWGSTLRLSDRKDSKRRRKSG